MEWREALDSFNSAQGDLLELATGETPVLLRAPPLMVTRNPFGCAKFRWRPLPPGLVFTKGLSGSSGPFKIQVYSGDHQAPQKQVPNSGASLLSYADESE